MEQNTYRYLQELSGSNFQLVDEEPNIIGWEVKNESGTYIGEVEELLFDPQSRAVRYLVVDLEDNGMNLEHKKVMIPLGIAHLHTSDDEVVLPGLHLDQYNALPAYDKDQIGPELEVQIRSIIGSPAALRIEETITEFDQSQFYNHHHFDKGRFYSRGGIQDTATPDQPMGIRSEQEVPVPDHMIHQGTDQPAPGRMSETTDEKAVPLPAHMIHPEASEQAPLIGRMSERTEEQDTIHQLVEHSAFNNESGSHREESSFNTALQNNDTVENNNEIISDLKGLVNILNDGKEGYESAAETTESTELKSLFLNFSAQRAAYANELKAHIAQHGGESENESGGVLGALHRTWIDIKQALTSKEDAAILAAIETGEKAAIEKFDNALEDPSIHADHITLLQKQRTGIREALSERNLSSSPGKPQ